MLVTKPKQGLLPDRYTLLCTVLLRDSDRNTGLSSGALHKCEFLNKNFPYIHWQCYIIPNKISSYEWAMEQQTEVEGEFTSKAVFS